jgi:hypothetical protein
MGNLTQLQLLGVAGAGTSALGSLATGFGQYESGQEQKQAYDYNAAIAIQRMQDQMQESEAKYSTLIGKQAASYAKSGVDVSSGSPLLVMAHTALMSGREQASEAQAGTEEANLQRYYGRVAAFQGTFGGITSFLTGLTKSTTSLASILST